jgi:hypothetical protein
MSFIKYLPLLLIVAGRGVHAGEDLQKFIDDAIRAGQQRIVVPAGKWKVSPSNRQHLLLKDLKDVQIIADDVEMVCTEVTRALTIENCENLTIRGLSIDYDPLPFTQGVIIAVADDKSWLEFKLLDGYPSNNITRRVEIYDRISNELKRDTYLSWKKFIPLGNRTYRIAKSDNYKYIAYVDAEEPGDFIVAGNEYTSGGSIPHAVMSVGCKNLVLENISVYASNCFAYYEKDCTGSVYINCSTDRRPLESDVKPRAYKRLRSANADAFHSKFATRGPRIINCTAKYQGDDAVNICGDYHLVTRCRGTSLRVLAKHELNISSGDNVELVDYDGKRIPDAKVLDISAVGNINTEEKTFLREQNMYPPMKNNHNGMLTRAYIIKLDRHIQLSPGAVIASTGKTGNGFVVKGCDFGNNRSRGILIKASSGQVIDNKLTNNWGEAIKVAPEWWWLESGSPKNLIISGNIIKDCRAVALAVYSLGGDGGIAPAGALNNIIIKDNIIQGCPLPNIVVTSTANLELTGNRLTPDTILRLISWKINKFKLNKELKEIMLKNCKNIKR